MRAIARILLAAQLLAGVAFAAPDELIGTGEFDIEGIWAGPNVNFAMDPEDYGRCDDLSDSIAGALVDVAQDGEARTCLIGLAPSTNYSFDGRLLFPAGQTSTGNASLFVRWKESVLNCEGSTIGGDVVGTPQPSSTSGVWVRHGMLDLVSPPGALTAYVGVVIHQSSGLQPLALKADGFHFYTGHGFLYYNGFEINSLCRWSSDVP